MLGPKGRFLHPISPKTTLAKDKKRKNRKSEEKERRGRKIAMVALLVFILATFLAENKTA